MNGGSTKPNNGNVGPSYISSNWKDEYGLMSKDPKGLYFFNYLTRVKLGKNAEIQQIDRRYSLDTISKNVHPNFVFVGDKFVLEDSEIDSLFAHVENGSKLFLAQRDLDVKIFDLLFESITLSFRYDLEASFELNKTRYKFLFLNQNDTVAHDWLGYKNILTRTQQKYKVLSRNGTLENNIAIPYGKGYVYLFSNPEAFFNYQLKTKAGYFYSNIWIDRFEVDEPLYWLEIGRFIEHDYDPDDFIDDGEDEQDDSLLQFIFGNPMYVIAMILLLLGVLFFVVFRAKRTQPIVPYLSQKKNMTKEFAETLTSIYFSNRDPNVMLAIQRKNFYDAILKHFFVDLSKRTGDKELNILSQKSNIPEQEIMALINGFESRVVVDEMHLIDMSKRQVAFYRQTGMISNRVLDKIDAKNFVLNRNLVPSGILILTGVAVFFFGLYLLVQSTGTGIILMPLGALMIVFGGIRLSRPMLTFNQERLEYSPVFGRVKVYDLDQIASIESSEKSCRFKFNGGKSLIVNYWELSRKDALQFQRFVAIQNKLML